MKYINTYNNFIKEGVDFGSTIEKEIIDVVQYILDNHSDKIRIKKYIDLPRIFKKFFIGRSINIPSILKDVDKKIDDKLIIQNESFGDTLVYVCLTIISTIPLLFMFLYSKFLLRKIISFIRNNREAKNTNVEEDGDPWGEDIVVKKSKKMFYLENERFIIGLALASLEIIAIIICMLGYRHARSLEDDKKKQKTELKNKVEIYGNDSTYYLDLTKLNDSLIKNDQLYNFKKK